MDFKLTLEEIALMRSRIQKIRSDVVDHLFTNKDSIPSMARCEAYLDSASSALLQVYAYMEAIEHIYERSKDGAK